MFSSLFFNGYRSNFSLTEFEMRVNMELLIMTAFLLASEIAFLNPFGVLTFFVDMH